MSTGRKVIVVHTIAIVVIFVLLLGVVSYVRQRRRTGGHVIVEENKTEFAVDELKTISTGASKMGLADKSGNGLFPVDWSYLKDVTRSWN